MGPSYGRRWGGVRGVCDPLIQYIHHQDHQTHRQDHHHYNQDHLRVVLVVVVVALVVCLVVLAVLVGYAFSASLWKP